MKPLYFRRYAAKERLFNSAPDPATHVIITIPACREPDLISTLRSLCACDVTDKHTEVLVLDNFPENEPPHNSLPDPVPDLPHLSFHMATRALPARKAGVGLARKLLMDEAAWRFHQLGREDGLIVGLDADCTVDPGYLGSLHRFQQESRVAGASIYYEHPLSGEGDPGLYQAIAEYELHLRYYVHARRWSGEWFAFQTVGSAMAVRSAAYQATGGMNTRKAGEDFYFLQKIMPHGFAEITDTCVRPSPRISERVPFGTGKAMKERTASSDQLRTYSPGSFKILRDFFCQSGRLYSGEPLRIEESLRNYFDSIDAWKDFERMRAISGTTGIFSKHLHTWMDGFRSMKALHHLREAGFTDVPVTEGAGWLAAQPDKTPRNDVDWLLSYFRALDSAAQHEPRR